MLDHLISPRLRLSVAGSVGVFFAIVSFVRITENVLPFFTQFPQFTPLERTTLLVKLFSPAVAFGLASGWMFFLLWAGEWLLTRRTKQASGSISPEPERLDDHGSAPAPPPMQEDDEKKELVPQVQEPPLVLDEDPAERASDSSAACTPSVTPPQEASEQETTPATSTEAAHQQEARLPIVIEETPSQEKGPNGNQTGEDFSQREETSEPASPITITLLKQVRAWVQATDGTRQQIRLHGGENALRLLILAYLTWRQGKLVDRDKLLTHVIARGKREDFDSEQLSQVFDGAKKFLRQDRDRTIKLLEEAGHPVAGPLDFFSHPEPGFYQLHPCGTIIDLAEVDRHHEMLLLARKQGLLDEKVDGSLPAWVIDACQKLIRAYSGDFLAELIEKYPEEFSGWVREPLTLYRDKYLDALLVLANYESALGRNFVGEQMREEERAEQRRAHIAKAAQRYYDYAMFCLNHPWDQKLFFAYRKGKDGERVIMAARALRRCVVELGKLGKTDMIDQVYLSFKLKMAKLSDGHWEPDTNTENDVAEAKKTTGAYRFTSQVRAVTTPQERPAL